MKQMMVRVAKSILADIQPFSRYIVRRPLRAYQLQPARAILRSVLQRRGDTFAVMMSRQAGKNELSAQLEAYLLNIYQRQGGSIVKASPTFKPQTINSLRRLRDRLDNDWNRQRAVTEQGYIVRLGKAEALFFSAEPTAHVVGATASLLLEGDEAQDLAPDKWDKDFRPMAASANATTVLYGTAWTERTLLAQTITALRPQEARDGRQRVFIVPWEEVAREVPEYGDYVRHEIARLGRQHPLIRTQYYLETVEAAGGMFDAARQALMRGDHLRQRTPTAGRTYAFLLDVAAGVESATEPLLLDDAALSAQQPRKDATALTIVDIETAIGAPKPLFRTVDRHWWLGERPTQQVAKVQALADRWHPQRIVVDATGVGEGVASFLQAAFGAKVTAVRLTASLKSQMGWDFLGIVETGRYRDYADDGEADTRQFWYEVGACRYEVQGEERLRWGVWETPKYDGVAHGHDDLLLSAALVAFLDQETWQPHVPSEIIAPPDPLDEMDGGRE